jgi:hypothetical protein
MAPGGLYLLSHRFNKDEPVYSGIINIVARLRTNQFYRQVLTVLLPDRQIGLLLLLLILLLLPERQIIVLIIVLIAPPPHTQ